MAKAISLFGKRIKEPSPLPQVPPDWIGTQPEYFVFWALLKLGMKGQFSYQVATMGGRLAKGGAVLDFYLPDLNLAINVQSTFWHYATTPQRISGELQRAQLESMGIRMIFIDEEDALRDPVYYVREALAGRSHSRMVR